MGNPAKKLREIRRRTGLSMEKFAKTLGLKGASSYQRYEKEETFEDGTPVPNHLAQRIIKHIVTKKLGQPPIKLQEITALIGIEEKPLGSAARDESDLDSTGSVRIGEIDIRAGLGGGGVGEAVNTLSRGGQVVSEDVVKGEWQVPAYYLHELGLTKNGLYLFRAIGDSMTRPDGGGIHSGDVLLADTKDKHPSPPGIFALDDGFGVVVKRLEFLAYSNPPRISVRSDNPAHASYELQAEEVRVIGRCVWYGRAL